jgi:hypothetical protein
VAAFYADEDFPLQTVEALRLRGHDVLTAVEAGQSNQRIEDDAVLAFATRSGRTLLTLNRWDFIRLSAQMSPHGGIVVCSPDPDVERQAGAIDAAARGNASLEGVLIRINRPA